VFSVAGGGDGGGPCRGGDGARVAGAVVRPSLLSVSVWCWLSHIFSKGHMTNILFVFHKKDKDSICIFIVDV
jgi:hypothetical protein